VKKQGKVSYAYRKEIARPAFVFEKPKSDEKTQRFISVVYPYDGTKAPEISLEENAGNNYENGTLNITITIDGKKSIISTRLF
jgi:heparan-sulfate lyase